MANLYRSHKKDDDDLYGRQMGELNTAFMAQDDFDLAYRLQLEEALRASREEQQPGPSDLTYASHSPEDRSLAFSFQNLELSLSHQQAADFQRVTQETERLHQELCLRAHDAKFAQTLNVLDDSDWDSHGDLCEDPFEADREDEDPPTFKVYVTSVVPSENPSVSAAIGAVVMDSQSIVMTEIKKPLDSAVGKAAADYMALIAGLEALVAMRMQHVDAFIDSVLVYNQEHKIAQPFGNLMRAGFWTFGSLLVGNTLGVVGMDGYKEEGSSSQDKQSNPTVHEVGEGSSQAEEGFPHAAFSITGTASPGTLFGGMQSMVPNPMYANIGLHPGFQGTQGGQWCGLNALRTESRSARAVEGQCMGLWGAAQVTRRWKVRSRRLQVLCNQVMELARKFEQFHANLVPRSENSHALRLAREALHLQPASVTEESTEAAEVKEFCPICLEGKKKEEIIQVSGCLHSFCVSCIVQHAEVKVQAGQVPVRCPHVSCSLTLSLSQCQSILSQKWFDLLNKRLIEVNMPEADRVYCPFPKCSALMNRKDLLASNDAASSSSFLTLVTPSRCMECFRLFCVECRVLWHTSMSCQQYQQLPPNLRDAQDAKLYQLAENQKWQRCKKCRRMIELAEGCYHMTCRCGYEFCYLCGEPWKNKRQSCRCRLWDEDFLLEEPLDNSEEDDEWEGSEGFSEDFEADYEDSEDFNGLNARILVDVSTPIHNRYYKTRLCKYWQRGCFWGENCKFAHGVHELRGVEFF
ncbi:hypothetical protein L7F22_058563 [Adiantum nelumboides]|nr:hypothetical protein [Adiantum nelumboides]